MKKLLGSGDGPRFRIGGGDGVQRIRGSEDQGFYGGGIDGTQKLRGAGDCC